MIIGHIYYALGVFVLLVHITAIINFNSLSGLIVWVKKFKKVTSHLPSASDYRNNSDYELSKFVKIFNVVISIWFCFGLLTASWKIFLLMIIGRLLLLFTKSDLFYRYAFLAINFTNVILTLLLIVNHFHLHLDLFQVITRIFF